MKASKCILLSLYLNQKCWLKSWNILFYIYIYEIIYIYIYTNMLSRVWLFCDPMDCCLPGSSVHGIFQARILKWFAISYSRGSSWPRNWNHVSCVSCIGRQILYHCVTWEVHMYVCVCVYIYEYNESLSVSYNISEQQLKFNLMLSLPLLTPSTPWVILKPSPDITAFHLKIKDIFFNLKDW